MPVTKTALLLATTFCLLLGTSVYAQETGAAASDDTAKAAAPDGLSMGRDADAAPEGVGTTYVAAEFGDWQQRCVRTEDGANPCQLYQLLVDAEANPVAEISVFGLPAGQQAAAGATIIVPLETLLTEEMTLIVDSSKPRKYPFSWCSPIGCFARIGFTADEVAAFKKGNKAEISIVPVVAPDQRVTVKVSLTGFTAGYDAVNKANGN